MRSRATARAAAALSLSALLAGAGRVKAQPAAGYVSSRPPNEDVYVYKEVPNVRITRAGADPTELSALWRDKPVLLAMVFTRCAGICVPFLRSLQSAASEAGGAGKDYRIAILSFDPADTAADLDAVRENLGIASNGGWIFGVATPADIRRLAEGVGFWFRWDKRAGQYDHPSMVVAVDRGRVLRMLVGATVSGTQLSEVVQEFRGKFVPSYALPGRIAFRCFEYDPASGRYSLEWGLLLLLLPGTFAIVATALVFSGARRRPKG
jgi:protein SCO1/2